MNRPRWPASTESGDLASAVLFYFYKKLYYNYLIRKLRYFMSGMMNGDIIYAVLYNDAEGKTYIYGTYRSFSLALEKKQECDKRKNVTSSVRVCVAHDGKFEEVK